MGKYITKDFICWSVDDTDHIFKIEDISYIGKTDAKIELAVGSRTFVFGFTDEAMLEKSYNDILCLIKKYYNKETD